MNKKTNALLMQGAGVLALVSAMAIAQQALADTAGGATIHNVATLSYAGGGAPVKAAVNVAVETVAAAPTIVKSTADQLVPAYSNADYTFTVTSNSNGSDSFALALSSTDSNTAASPGLSFLLNGGAVTSIILGGSVTSQASGVGVVYIPAGSQSNLSVNDIVDINGDLYTVTGVTTGTPASTNVLTGITTAEVPSSLTLAPVGGAPAITAGSVPAGTQVGEQVTLVQRVVASAPATPAPATHTVSFTATSTATDLADNPVVYSSTPDGNDTVTTVIPATTSLFKVVRNASRPNGNAAATGPATCGGNTYYTSGVTSKTGDTLEYCLLASVALGASMPLTGAVIADDIPPFTAYVPNSTTLNGSAVADEGGTTPLATSNAGMDVNSPGEPAGEIAIGDSATVTFQVTVQ
ncbi:MAG: hypothetical protein K0R03_504 [Moraxellaceae bacterium]|jgi:hypothetical protein|nr:hypothetical protein [Moraxellaceae bacterium]